MDRKKIVLIILISVIVVVIASSIIPIFVKIPRPELEQNPVRPPQQTQPLHQTGNLRNPRHHSHHSHHRDQMKTSRSRP
jgi:hypothetical protein